MLTIHRKVIAGSDTLVKDETLTSTWTNGDTHFLQVVTHGTNVRVYVDNVIQMDTTLDDSAINAGTKHGLFSDEHNATNRWNDFGGYKSLFYETLSTIRPHIPIFDKKLTATIQAFDDFERFRRIDLKFANTIGSTASHDILAELLDAGQADSTRRYLGGKTPAAGETFIQDADEGLKGITDDLLTAIYALQTEEDGLVYQDGMGHVVFEDRGHRSTAPHLTSKATLKPTADGTNPVMVGLDWDDGDDNVENVFEIGYQQATKAGADTVVFTHDEASTSPASTLQFDANETKFFICELDNVCDGMVTPLVSSTHFTGNSAADGTGTDQTAAIVTFAYVDSVGTGTERYAGKYVKVQVTWGPTAGYLTKFQLEGRPRTDQDVATEAQENSTSVTDYGERPFKHTARFLHRQADVKVMVASRRARRVVPRTHLTTHHRLSDHRTLHHLMQRRISDRVSVDFDAAGEMGVAEDFFLEGETWDIPHGSDNLKVSWQLRGIEFEEAVLSVFGDDQIALWVMKDTGLTLEDLTGNGHTLTWSEPVEDFDTAPTALGGGWSVVFNGSDEQGSVVDAADLSFGNGTVDTPFSVVALIKTSDPLTGGSQIVGKWDSANPREWRVRANDDLRFTVQDSSAGAWEQRKKENVLSAATRAFLAYTYGGDESHFFQWQR